MKKIILLLLPISILLFGCTINNQTNDSDSEIAMPEITENTVGNNNLPESISGSWHASPSVSAGFNDRFIFTSNGQVKYMPDRNNEANEINYKSGVYEYANGNIEIKYTTVAYQDGTSETVDEGIRLSIDLVEEDMESPYSEKITLSNGMQYWKYSDNTDIWEEID